MAIIFVTGAARSGTSLVTKILQAHGCNLGPSHRVNRLYENTDIRQRVIKPYLQSIGSDPLGQDPLPDTDNLPPIPRLRERVEGFMKADEPWVYKDAKLTLIWPRWHEAFPEAKWILVRRDKEKIAESCLRTGFMRAYDGKPGWIRWAEAHEKRFEGMKRDLALVEIWTDDLVHDPETFRPIAEFCGLTFNGEATGKAIDRDFWH